MKTIDSVTELEIAQLATIRGGTFPGGGGSPSYHLGGVTHLGHQQQAPHCDKLGKGVRQLNNPNGTALTSGGGLVQFPMASCPATRRQAPPAANLGRFIGH